MNNTNGALTLLYSDDPRGEASEIKEFLVERTEMAAETIRIIDLCNTDLKTLMTALRNGVCRIIINYTESKHLDLALDAAVDAKKQYYEIELEMRPKEPIVFTSRLLSLPGFKRPVMKRNIKKLGVKLVETDVLREHKFLTLLTWLKEIGHLSDE